MYIYSYISSSPGANTPTTPCEGAHDVKGGAMRSDFVRAEVTVVASRLVLRDDRANMPCRGVVFGISFFAYPSFFSVCV